VSISNPLIANSKYNGIISLEGNTFDIGGAESGVYKLPNKSFSLYYGNPSPIVLSEGGLLFLEKLTGKRIFKLFSFNNLDGEHICYFGDTSGGGKFNKYGFSNSDGKLLINSGEIPSDSTDSFYLSGTTSNTSGIARSSSYCYIKDKELYSNNSTVANVSAEQTFSRKKLTQLSIIKAVCSTNSTVSEKEVILQDFENIDYTMIDVVFTNFPNGSSSLKVKNDVDDTASSAYPIKKNRGNGNFEDIESGE